MYICLYKGVAFFSKDMKLDLERDGERLLVPLWSAYMTWEVTNASFVRFDRYFSLKLRSLLFSDNLRIPKLLDFIRPMEFTNGLKFSHNWAEIIPYPISIIFILYGYRGTPHPLPY